MECMYVCIKNASTKPLGENQLSDLILTQGDLHGQIGHLFVKASFFHAQRRS